MKKAATLLLTFILLFSVSSCNGTSNNTPPTESLTAPPTPTVESQPQQQEPQPENGQPTPAPEQILTNGKYHKMERVELTTVRYTLYNYWGDTVFSETIDRPIEISMLGRYIIDVRIGMGTGITTHRYYDVRDSFSNTKEYSYVIASSENLVAYLDGELNSRKVVVKSIFDDTFYKDFEVALAETPMPVSSAALSSDTLYMNYNENTETQCRVLLRFVETERDPFADYSSLLEFTQDLCATATHYDDTVNYAEVFGITDAQETEWLGRLLSSLLSLFHGYEHREFVSSIGYDVRDLNGDGVEELVLLRADYEVIAIFTKVNGKPFLLDNYWERRNCTVDHKGLLYINGSNGADASSRQVYRIAEDGASLELIAEFGTDGYEWVDNASVQKYYELVSGERVAIEELDYQLLCQQYPYAGTLATQELSGLTFTQIGFVTATERETANQAYIDVLENQAKVYHTETNEYVYLTDCKTPYENTPLSAVSNLSYALVDLDGDLLNELIIDCGDLLILRYYEGTVYLYPFVFRNMYDLNTDGSYTWSHNGADFEHGQGLIYFDGTTLKTYELWSIVNDGTPNAVYYIGDRQVTQDELTAYVNATQRTKITFAPLDLSAIGTISLQEALELASKYWNVTDGYTEGALGKRIVHRLVPLADSGNGLRYYRIAWIWEYSSSVDNYASVSHFYCHQILLVDAITGTCTLYTEPTSK